MITEAARLLGEGAEVMAVNCTNRVNLAMMIGGFVSRRLGFPRIGRPILFYGSRGAFYQIVNLVEITRLKACHKAGEENCT